jgi:GGDEF domain-containing protein
MQDLLDACVELEELAVKLYTQFAESTEDEELRRVFLVMRAEEADHLSWWSEVRARANAGEVSAPDLGSQVNSYLRAIVETLRTLLASATRALDDDQRLSLAASLEFFALDPVFAWLIRESHRSLGPDRHEAYARHVELLISTMEARDSWPLAPHIALLRAANDPTPHARSSELHDSVTGLPPRVVAENAVTELCADPAAELDPISLAIIDVALESPIASDPANAQRILMRIIAAWAPLLRFTDLLVMLDEARFGVVFPATRASTARAAVSALADAASSIAMAEAGDGPSTWTRSAVVTFEPGGIRCTAATAFQAAEALLSEARAAGVALLTRTL